MPHRSVVSRELAELLGVLAHPNRLRIVEELRRGELGVGALRERLGIAQSGVSQHLALLRAHRIVAERREGRHVHYRLLQPELAGWLLEGLAFVHHDVAAAHPFRGDARRARAAWTASA